jgi:hypothetical protein
VPVILESRRRRRGCHNRDGLPHATDKAEAAAPEATEAATAAPTPMTGTPTHGHEPTREGAMAAFARSWHREAP